MLFRVPGNAYIPDNIDLFLGRAVRLTRRPQKQGRHMPEYFEQNFHEYRQHIDAGRNPRAVEAALDLLAKRKNTDPAQYSADHKGSPFYVLGYAAFASHDYPSASLYFDAAVAADLSYHRGNHNTSALRFMQLLTTQGEPLLARDIIAAMIVSTEKLLNDYNSRPGAQPITLGELEAYFRCSGGKIAQQFVLDR
jgi:hypothetical protein